MEKRREKSSIQLKNAYATRNLHNSFHRVASLRGTWCFAKYFRHYSALSKKRRGKNISDTLACSSCATSLCLRHFDVICDLLLNRRTATSGLPKHGIYRYMDDVRGNLFSWFFFPKWRAVLKMFVRLFRIKASESLEKSLAGAIYKEEKWRNGDQKSYWLLDNA